MKCFEVVRRVLNATYEEIPGKEAARDKKIQEAMDHTSTQYSDRLMEEGGPNFNNATTRFGYVLRYVPAHGHWLFDLLSQTPKAKKILKQGNARVTCIGGGPGSDVVGILKFLDENKIECRLFCEIIDGCAAWKQTWVDLAWQIGSTGLFTDYVIHDVANSETWSSPSTIGKSDIITLSFFVSEIFHLPTTEAYLAGMLSRAKSGAVLLVNDNRTPRVYRLIDRLSEEAGFKKLGGGEGDKRIFDSGEDMKLIQKYVDKFGKARLTGKVAWRTYIKG